MPALMLERSTARILVVDDDEAVTLTFASMLRLEGYKVDTAFDAESALEVAAERRPDAIILDLRMPIADGVALLRQLRAREEHRDVPVAIVTGDYFVDESVTDELRVLNARLRFKPLWLEDLVRLARTLLKVSH